LEEIYERTGRVDDFCRKGGSQMTKEKLEAEVKELRAENGLLKVELEAIRSKKTALLAGVQKMIDALEGINEELWDLGATEKDGG
jgi:hypothetical protein